MYYSPYTQQAPFYPPPYYQMMDQEKHGLRKAASRTSFTILLSLLTVETLFQILTAAYAKSGYYTYSFSGTSHGMPLVLFYLLNDISYIAMAIPPLIYFSASHMTASRGLPFKKTGLPTVLACAAFGTAVCQLANIPANVVIEWEEKFGFSGTFPQMPVSNDPLVLLLYFLFFAVIPPLVEEMLFRGAVLQSLRRYGDGFAVVCSALLFGLYHGNLVQFVFAFIAGLAMAYVDVRTESLLPSLLIHFCNNFIASLLDVLQTNYGASTANSVSTYIFFASLALGIISFLYLSTKKKFFRRNRPVPLLPLSSRIAAFFSNPGVICTLIFFVFSSAAMLKAGF